MAPLRTRLALAAALLCVGVMASPVAHAGSPAATTVWAVGDADLTPSGKALSTWLRARNPTRLLYLGDVYESGSGAEFARRFDPLYGAIARRVIPTPGNHEWANHATGYDPYWLTHQGRAPGPWFARHIGSWEILSLNSEAPHAAGSSQLAWLRRATRAPGTCRIVLWHRPRWSTGWHGDQPDLAPLWNAVKGHARIVLSGHDHDLQRFADRDGLRQYVSGAGGRFNIPVTHGSGATLRFADRSNRGALRLRLSRGRAELAFIATGGRVLDRSVTTCTPLR
ncbi:unannotated protein [freshwater metagenome]|uniref:Unannotated protein n=1 Tax=freshwater metagenome TaxID=449393 RepID=A0A6J7CU00_9ZZZZ